MSINSGFGLADDPIVNAKIKISETAEAVSKQSRELADIIETVSAGWTGVGANAFKGAQIMINEDHDRIRTLLGVLHNAVAQTKNLSNAQDEEVLQAFRKLGSDSGPAAAPPANTSGLNGV
ncbi:WXG100 family type VII secretion target [Streptomyces goshikiensis]|uniref:WXG100 family type VII secretion target n=1 Tax=Streptomyces goshikiensis TaxID=1942 RepID=UPI00331F0D07